MYKVEIAASAEIDLQEAYLWYVENGSLDVAERWKNEILKKADSLSQMPERCAFAPEHFFSTLELRCIRCFSHLLIFEIVGDRVIVKRIRHGRQRPHSTDSLDTTE